MAIETFQGRGKLVKAYEAALSTDYTAILVQNVVANTRRVARAGNYIDALYSAIPEMVEADELLRRWAEKQMRTYQGLYDPKPRSGGIVTHWDGYAVSPFALSLGLSGKGHWQTQKVDFDYLRRHEDQFNPDIPIDTFTQNAGDLVIIPGIPSPSMHAVTTEAGRTALVCAMRSPSNASGSV